MDEIRFERLHESVDARINTLKSALKDESIQFIECKCIDNGHAPLVVLGLTSFLEACLINKPPIVFVYREASLIEEQIAITMQEINGDPNEQERLGADFRLKESAIVSEVLNSCPEFFLTQCFFSIGPTLVVMGGEVDAYSKFIMALESFEETVGEFRKSERVRVRTELQKQLTKIAERVAEDEGFISLRGRRKRAMYVLQNYRSEIPESENVERPDQGSDLMDKNLVEVSRRAADIIEFGSCASPFTDE